MGPRPKAPRKVISVLVSNATPMNCQLLCRALKRSFGQFRVISCVADSRTLVDEIRNHRPDVAVLSLHLRDGPTAGFKVLAALRGSGCATRVVMLLDSSDHDDVLNAFAGGAQGVFCRSESFGALPKCIRCVYDGQIWADSSQMESLLEALASSRPLRIVNTKGVPLLTKREDEIAHLVATGFANQEISSRFRLKLHTVKNHLFHIYEKLGISSRGELILYALSHQGTSNSSSHSNSEKAAQRSS